MSNMNSFFDELVEAKKAMERLPTVERQLSFALGEASVTRDRLDKAFQSNDELRLEIETLYSTLRAKEIALADATFRESEVRTKLEMLVGTFKTVVGEAQAAVELIEPKPEPVVQAIPIQAEGDDGDFVPLDVGNAHLDQQPIQNSGVNTTAPSESFSDSSGSFVDTDTALRPSGESDTNPTQADGSGQSSNTTTSMPTTPSTSESTWHGYQREADPITASATVEPETSTAPIPAVSTDSSPPEPAAPRPYWLKPDRLSWAEWITSGNEYPQWINADGSTKAGYGSF